MNSIRIASLLLLLVSVVSSQSQDPVTFCGVQPFGRKLALGNYCDANYTGYYECSGQSPRYVQCPASTHCGCFQLNCNRVPTVGAHAPCVRDFVLPAIPTDFTAVTYNTQLYMTPYVNFIYGSANALKTYINPNTANETSYLTVPAAQGTYTYLQTTNSAGNRVCSRSENPNNSVASATRAQFDFATPRGLRYEFFGRNTTAAYDTYYSIESSGAVIFKYSVSLTNPPVPVSATVESATGVEYNKIQVQSFNIMTAPASNFVVPASCNN